MSYNPITTRFNNLLPIIVDVETGGINCNTDALLEAAAVCINHNQEQGFYYDTNIWHEHIEPFPGSKCHPEALEFNKIIPNHPLRFAITEEAAITSLAKQTKIWLKQHSCKKAVLVGHNAHFDLNFLMQAVARTKTARFPFHSFTCFDTATLGGLFYQKTVLAQIIRAAKIKFDISQAHGALYDATKTAELFCHMLNSFDKT